MRAETGRRLAAAALAFAVASPLEAATVTFADTEMDLANYDLFDYAQPGYATSTTQETEGGSNRFLAYGYVRMGANPPSNRLQAFNTGFVYDPGLQGAIASIDAALDQRIFVSVDGQQLATASLAQSIRVLAMQDGSVYRSTTFGAPIGGNSIWHSVSTIELTADRFGLFDPANPSAPLGGPGLDFAGSAITFGFELALPGTSRGGMPLTTETTQAAWQADNFRLTVNTLEIAGGVPEPGTWALLILGFGAVGSALRRSKKHRVSLAYA